MHGKSNKTISRDLRIAEATVKNHVRTIFKALNVSNRTEAAVAAGQIVEDMGAKSKPLGDASAQHASRFEKDP